MSRSDRATAAPQAKRDRPDPEFDNLATELITVFNQGVRNDLADDEFNQLALGIFGYQFANNPVYRAFCRKRQATPATIELWSQIPAVPTTAFKQLPLISGDHPAAAVFRTSGTMHNAHVRGTHHVRSLALYHAALTDNFRAHLRPESGPIRTFSLIPSPVDQPESSLSHMVAQVMSRFGNGRDEYFVRRPGGLDVERFLSAAEDSAKRGEPVLVLGTAFAFVHLGDALSDSGRSVRLPEGSRIMETGGFKGRSRELSWVDLYGLVERTLGVAAAWIVNEYGMTELLSQFYDGVAGQAAPVRGGDGASPRRHRPPPWVRTRVLDPVTLAPVSDGGVGILAHLDLANLGTVSALLTEDLGIGHEDGFEVLGRASDAEPRGCSIAMDDLLAATAQVP